MVVGGMFAIFVLLMFAIYEGQATWPHPVPAQPAQAEQVTVTFGPKCKSIADKFFHGQRKNIHLTQDDYDELKRELQACDNGTSIQPTISVRSN